MSLEDLKEAAYPLEDGSVPRQRFPFRRWLTGDPTVPLFNYLRAGVALVLLGLLLVYVGAEVSGALEGCSSYYGCIDGGAAVWIAGYAAIVLGFITIFILLPAAGRRRWRY